MEALESEARRLARTQALMVPAIQTKQAEIIENWERLNDLFDERYWCYIVLGVSRWNTRRGIFSLIFLRILLQHKLQDHPELNLSFNSFVSRQQV